jgi:hypothetical protein
MLSSEGPLALEVCQREAFPFEHLCNETTITATDGRFKDLRLASLRNQSTQNQLIFLEVPEASTIPFLQLLRDAGVVRMTRCLGTHLAAISQFQPPLRSRHLDSVPDLHLAHACSHVLARLRIAVAVARQVAGSE